MNIFFTSDLHYSHQNIIKYCPWNRPWETAHEMNIALTEAWNSTVKDNDIVYFLGDFAMKSNLMKTIFPILNGRKIIISGNHDSTHSMHKKSAKSIEELKALDSRIEAIRDDMSTTIGKWNVKLNHFPYYEGAGAMDDYGYEVRYQEYRPTKGSEAFLLHGHTHSKPENRLNIEKRSYDVGWDPNGKLLHIDEIETIIRSVVG